MHRMKTPPLSFICSFIGGVKTRRLSNVRSISSMSTISDSNRGQTTSMMANTNRYQIHTDETANKWVHISFDDLDDTTKYYPPAKQKGDDTTSKTLDESSTSTIPSIPESVLQWERSMRAIRAADRASKTNVNIAEHLHTVYQDDDIVATNKPSGILCVPGVNKNRSLLDLVYEVYGSPDCNDEEDKGEEERPSTVTPPPLPRDSMIVHRLDMDTSGIVIFARTRVAMSELHASFRERSGTKKVYEALLVGTLDINRWIDCANDKDGNVEEDIGSSYDTTTALGGGVIHLPLQRDHCHPPFMRVSTMESESEAQLAVKDLNSAGYKKLMAKKPKASTTQFRILSHETWNGHPVTRVELTPITGRTHQLRVHCAALGHPILGDSAYGFCGEAHPNGGFTDEIMQTMSPTNAAFELRRDVEEIVQKQGRTICLHARSLTLQHHPITKEEISFEAEPTF